MDARAFALALAFAVLGASCGGAREPAGEPGQAGPRYGISAAAPDGWSVRIARGALVAATYRLPPTARSLWDEMRSGLDEDGMRLLLVENAPENTSPPPDLTLYRELALPIRFDPGHFRDDPNDAGGLPTARRLFRHSGRLFAAFVQAGSRPPSAEALAGLNELLGSLEIEPGDFYAGTVEPPRFTPRPGWHVGDSGVDDVDADGEWTTAWASTIPYTDAWNALPPSETLERLPEDGTVVWVNLWREGGFPSAWPEHGPPFDLDTFERHAHWEGQIRDLPEHRLWATVNGDAHLDLRVFFGRPDPTAATREEAQAMLDGLVLPAWGPWELED